MSKLFNLFSLKRFNVKNLKITDLHEIDWSGLLRSSAGNPAVGKLATDPQCPSTSVVLLYKILNLATFFD